MELAIAMGHGRSFGMSSRILGRELPGIKDCGLWPHLGSASQTGPAPLAAIADLGNDLVYGAGADTLLDWLADCLQRLHDLGSETVLLSLPKGSLSGLTETRFELARRLIFPGHRIAWPVLRDEIAMLDHGMRELGRQFGAAWVEAPEHWYGLDPIHIRRQQHAAAWQAVFSRWSTWQAQAPVARSGFLKQLALRQLRPSERKVFGFRQLTPQPLISQPDYQLFLF